MKTCARCKIEKPLDEFGKNAECKDGLARYCRECARVKNAAWEAANKDKVKVSHAKHREANREKYRAAGLQNYYAHREKYLAYSKEWYKKNPDKARAGGRRHDAKPHRKLPRGDSKARQARHYKKHLERRRADRRAYQAKRRSDPAQRLVDTIRRRMRHVIRGKSKGAFALLGYGAAELRDHIAAQFKSGMTWDNYGLYGEKWHVDHIRPVSSFKLPDEIVDCFALPNLQPLWAKDNLSKHNKRVM